MNLLNLNQSMTLLVGPALCLGVLICVYCLRKWFLLFRPDMKSSSHSAARFPGATIILGALFYLIILPLSYIELMLELSQKQESNHQHHEQSSGYSEITED